MKNIKPLITLLLFLPLISNSQSHNLAMVDSFMRAKAAIHNFNGNVLIAKDGKVLYQKSFGYSNLETKEPLNENTIFELASVSKQFTAMGILLLHQNKKLSLQDSLRKFFPELPYSKVTIHHLLTHTSGLPHYEPLMEEKWDHKKIAFNPDIINILSTEKPSMLFKPGLQFEYNNTGYILLASVIEKVSGQSYADYLRKNVFAPLNMKHTRVYNTRRSGERIQNYAYGYMWSKKLKKYVLPDSVNETKFVYYLDGIQGDGIINSTTGDLLIWDRALNDAKLLQPDLQKQMLSKQAVMDSSKRAYYGYGMMLDSTKYGKRIRHSGGWPGYWNHYSRYLQDDICVILLSNNFSNTIFDDQLVALLRGESVVFPFKPKAIDLNPALLDRYTGTYKYKGQPALKITRKGDNLYVVMGDETLLKPESEKVFYLDLPDKQTIEFEFDEPGNVKRAIFMDGEVRFELQK